MEIKRKHLSQKKKMDLDDLEKYIRDFSYFLPLPVCTLNPTGIIIDINQSAKELTGYDEITLIGQDIEFLFEDKESAGRLLREVLKKGVVRNKSANLLTSGKGKMAVSVSASARKDVQNNIIGYFIAIFNISELKKLQEGLETKVKVRTGELEGSQKALLNILEDVEEARKGAEEEKNKTLAIINNFTDGLFVFDEKNKVLLINPQAGDFLKIKKEDIIGRFFSELSKVAALKPLVEILGERIDKISKKEFKIKEDLVLEITIAPVMREKEKLGSLLILHDITREKLIEELKTEFVSLAAHQLRTPLSAIKWTVKMILEGDLGKINKEQREFLEGTYKSNERMINLVNSLLNVSRIEEGKYISNLVLTDIEELVKKVIISYKKESQKRGTRIEFRKPKKKLPKIMLDVEKMRIAIDNLMKNALKYTIKDGKIIVSLSGRKKEIEISVKDNGIGIPKSQQKMIFIKFFRGTNVSKIDTTGSGLGLYITKNIINAHKGKIRFESKENIGTTFYITLPIVRGKFTEFLKGF